MKSPIIFSRDVGVSVRIRSKIFLQIYTELLRLLSNGSPKSLELHLVKSSAIQKLNKKYRNKNKPTDILSFPSQTPRSLGSLVIDVDTARKQAKEYRHSLERELCELFVHGVLHLLGFDHEKKAEAVIMKKYEDLMGLFLHRKLRNSIRSQVKFKGMARGMDG